MLSENMSNLVSNLAIALVLLFSGLQLWWAIEALEQARHMETAGGRTAASHAAANAWYQR